MTTPSEAGTLLAYLAAQRRHVLGILEDLDDDALRRPVLPSGWSCLALLQHLTFDVERLWFRAVVAGDPAVLDDSPEDAWQLADDVTGEQLLAAYRAEARLADEVLAGADLDAPPGWWPTELFGDAWLANVREVVLHVLVELACHAGHLDAARELLDGRQWLVLG